MNHPSNNTVPVQWWKTPRDEILRALRVDSERGLSDEQVRSHREALGANTLEEIRPASIWELIFDGVKEPMMIVLLSIAALSVVFGKPVEAVVMIFVVAAYIHQWWWNINGRRRGPISANNSRIAALRSAMAPHPKRRRTAGGEHPHHRRRPAFILAAHRNNHVVLNVWNFRQPFGVMLLQVVAEFLHGGDSLWVDGFSGAATCTVWLDPLRTVHSGKRLGHLAAVGVLPTDEQQARGTLGTVHLLS
jgi:hypothetical protein